MDAAGLRPDACLAKFFGVAAARHFALGFTLLVHQPPHLSALRPSAGKEAPPRVEQVASAVAERAPNPWRRRKVAAEQVTVEQDDRGGAAGGGAGGGGAVG